MINGKLEQELANIRDTLPHLWWALYQGCVSAGFGELQSFALLQTYILAQNPFGIRPLGALLPDEGNQ